jgi:hypothetical protein
VIFAFLWSVLLVAGLALEAITLYMRRGTLSQQVAWLRRRLWGELLIVPAWIWLTYHWFVDVGYGWGWDVLALAVGVVIAIAGQRAQRGAANTR